MKIRQVILCALFFGTGCFALNSQTAVDALRYSELLPSGTARMVGVGGAMSSLGGDMGSLTINPAGLAVYRKSEFTLSPAIQFTSVGSRFNDEASNKENASKFGIENIGIVFYKGYNKPKLKSFNFGVAINRIVNFNRTTEYAGKTAGSIINAFQNNGQGLTSAELDPFTSGIASDAGAIFNLDGSGAGDWFSDFDSFEDLAIEKKETIVTTGGVSDLSLNLAVNISDKLYVGAAASFPIVRFEETRNYEEDDRTDDVVPFFRDLTYDQTISTTGVGLGFKAGFIFRITNEIRLGGGVHSPTKYTLSDDFTTSMRYFYLDENDPSVPLIDGEGFSPNGEFEYALNTPWRFNGGVSVVLKKFGFISLDIEHFDYSSMEYDFLEPQFVDSQEIINAEFSRDFTDALNVKIGAEYLINKFRIRAGYGIYGSAFDDESKSRNVLSLGVGVRGENAYLDLAFRNTSASENYSPYISPNQYTQRVFNDITTNNLIFTFGYRF